MGDIIEKTLMSYDPVEFYKLGGKSIWIDIKARGIALIGLTSSPESQICKWIEICNPGTIRLNIGTGRGTQTNLPFTLSNEHFTRIWLAWDSKCLWAGVGHSLKVLASCELKIAINYFTISTRDRVHPSTFRFEVPPLCLTMPIANTPKITAGKLEWKSCDNQLPDDAIIGGHINGEVVYIIRARHRGSLTPGAFIPSQGLAFVPWGGSDNPNLILKRPDEQTAQRKSRGGGLLGSTASTRRRSRGDVRNGKVLRLDAPTHLLVIVASGHSPGTALCGFNFEWKPACDTRIPAAAFTAGYSEDQHEPLFIGRAKHQGHILPGKVQMTHKVCYIPYEGREVAVTQFDVLTVPGANPYSASELLILPFLTEQEEDRDFYEDGDYQDHEENYAF